MNFQEDIIYVPTPLEVELEAIFTEPQDQQVCEMIEGIERNETVSLKRKVIAAFGGHRLETVPLPKLRKLEAKSGNDYVNEKFGDRMSRLETKCNHLQQQVDELKNDHGNMKKDLKILKAQYEKHEKDIEELKNGHRNMKKDLKVLKVPSERHSKEIKVLNAKELVAREMIANSMQEAIRGRENLHSAFSSITATLAGDGDANEKVEALLGLCGNPFSPATFSDVSRLYMAGFEVNIPDLDTVTTREEALRVLASHFG